MTITSATTYTNPTDLPTFNIGQVVDHPEHGKVTLTDVETKQMPYKGVKVPVSVKLTGRAGGRVVSFPAREVITPTER